MMENNEFKFWEAVANTAKNEMLSFFPDSDPDSQAAERVFALLKAHAPQSAFNPEDVAAWRRLLLKASLPPKKQNLLQRLIRRLEIR